MVLRECCETYLLDDFCFANSPLANKYDVVLFRPYHLAFPRHLSPAFVNVNSADRAVALDPFRLG